MADIVHMARLPSVAATLRTRCGRTSEWSLAATHRDGVGVIDGAGLTLMLPMITSGHRGSCAEHDPSGEAARSPAWPTEMTIAPSRRLSPTDICELCANPARSSGLGRVRAPCGARGGSAVGHACQGAEKSAADERAGPHPPGRSIRAVSTRTGSGPRVQFVALREYAAARGWEALEYVDHAPAGDLAHRTAWRQLRATPRGRFDILMVWKLDRAFRSPLTPSRPCASWSIEGRLRQPDPPELDTTSPTGRLVFTILAAVAEMERSLIATA